MKIFRQEGAGSADDIGDTFETAQNWKKVVLIGATQRQTCLFLRDWSVCLEKGGRGVRGGWGGWIHEFSARNSPVSGISCLSFRRARCSALTMAAVASRRSRNEKFRFKTRRETDITF